MDYQHLPTKSGIYLFKDLEGQVLYVGKAINLKSRVKSYFSGSQLNRPWLAVMIDLIANIETIVVNNEVEALMLEATLIKQHQPKFNIKLADDKSYPYIKLTINEPLPRLQVIRQRPNDKAKYFGPYLSARTARTICELLREAYGVHISSRLLAVRTKPCFNCQLSSRQCPLAGELDQESYQLAVQKAIEFLQGKQTDLVRVLTAQMEQASFEQKYEMAAKIRDQLQTVHLIATNQQVISTIEDDYDAFGAYATNHQAGIAILHIRQGRVVRQTSHCLDINPLETLADIIRGYIIGYYGQFTYLPPLTVIPVPLEDQTIIEKWLGSIVGRSYELRSAERGEKKAMVELANKNAEQAIETRLLTADRQFQGLIALKELLKLSFIPERIEAIDISNLGASETVGASVCFINGQPAKDEYRRYKIKTVVGQNDFAMIAEVTSRRLADISRPLPDILIIDGGPEQLKAAIKGEELGMKNKESRDGKTNSQLLEARGQKPIFIALAKKPDRIFLPGRRLPVAVTHGNKGLLLLAKIRDETHRFVISYHRSRQRKKSLATKE